MAGEGGPPVAGLLQPCTVATASQGEPEGQRSQALGHGMAPTAYKALLRRVLLEVLSWLSSLEEHSNLHKHLENAAA